MEILGKLVGISFVQHISPLKVELVCTKCNHVFAATFIHSFINCADISQDCFSDQSIVLD
jgi:hypothetical protein